MHISKVW